MRMLGFERMPLIEIGHAAVAGKLAPIACKHRARQILESDGLPQGNIYMVAGKADTEPLFPDNPSLSTNRRVTILMMREEPPIPPDFKP